MGSKANQEADARRTLVLNSAEARNTSASERLMRLDGGLRIVSYKALWLPIAPCRKVKCSRPATRFHSPVKGVCGLILMLCGETEPEEVGFGQGTGGAEEFPEGAVFVSGSVGQGKGVAVLIERGS